MVDIYIPKKVIEARLKVEAEHTKVARGKAHKDDDSLKELIERIVALQKGQVKTFARVLSAKQVHQISEYICLNFWKVKLDNLFDVLIEKGEKEEWWTIYSNWQNRYDRGRDAEEIRKFLSSTLLNNRIFADFIEDNRWNPTKMLWLSNDQFIHSLCSECLKNTSIYVEELLSHGVIKESSLYNRCLIVFFQICDRHTLLSEGAQRLKEKYLTWTRVDKEKFCINLYDKIKYGDILSLRELLRALDKDFEDHDMKRILTENGYSTYLAWVNIQAVESAFFADEDRNRREFWMKYIIGNKFQNYYHTLIIDFGNYVAVEFKGKAAGPAYVYKKRFFQNVVLYQMNRLSKVEFQKWEYAKYQEHIEGICERMPHNDGWQWNFEVVLRSYGIKKGRLN